MRFRATDNGICIRGAAGLAQAWRPFPRPIRVVPVTDFPGSRAAATVPGTNPSSPFKFRGAVLPLADMRSLWFLPLTFLAGVHGFAIFAPYLAVIFAALHLRSRRRARLAATVPVPVLP